MTSLKQIEANRRNAQKSTGPRTAEGRSHSRQNAKRDGITGQVVTLSDDDRPIFEQFKKDMLADLRPKTTVELSIAHAIAWDTWRLNHLRAVEANLYALGAENSDIHCPDSRIQNAMADAATFTAESQRFALMSIYEQRLNRSLHKNLVTLRDMQAERETRESRDRSEEMMLAEYCEIKGLAYSAPSTPSKNGFVFSNNEIFSALNRNSVLFAASQAIFNSPMKVRYAGASSSVPSSLTNWLEKEAA